MASAEPSNTIADSTGMIGLRTTVIVGVVVCYVALCRALRCLRRDQQHSQMPYKTREDFKKMTAEDAWQIIKYVQSLEFPWMTKKALSFALFKYVHVDCKHLGAHLIPRQNVRHTVNFQATLRDTTA